MPEYIVLADGKPIACADLREAMKIRDLADGEIYEHVPRVTPLADLLRRAIEEQQRVKVRIAE